MIKSAIINNKKVAIILVGAVGLENSGYVKGQMYNKSKKIFTDYNESAKFIKKHIVDANKSILYRYNVFYEFDFDFFIHSWTYELEDELLKLYNPKKYKFEDNNLYKDEFIDIAGPTYDYNSYKNFNQLSWSLSIKRGIELMEEYEQHYDYVIITRPDLLFFNDMKLTDHDVSGNSVYVTDAGGPILERYIERIDRTLQKPSDVFFIMNYETAKGFKYLYDSVSSGNTDDLVIHEFPFIFLMRQMNKYVKLGELVWGRDLVLMREKERFHTFRDKDMLKKTIIIFMNFFILRVFNQRQYLPLKTWNDVVEFITKEL
jgi:hypothetical protein